MIAPNAHSCVKLMTNFIWNTRLDCTLDIKSPETPTFSVTTIALLRTVKKPLGPLPNGVGWAKACMADPRARTDFGISLTKFRDSNIPTIIIIPSPTQRIYRAIVNNFMAQRNQSLLTSAKSISQSSTPTYAVLDLLTTKRSPTEMAASNGRTTPTAITLAGVTSTIFAIHSNMRQSVRRYNERSMLEW